MSAPELDPATLVARLGAVDAERIAATQRRNDAAAEVVRLDRQRDELERQLERLVDAEAKRARPELFDEHGWPVTAADRREGVA